MRPGFEDLVVVDEEILPQHGLGERGAESGQILDAHAEVGAVGQNRDRAHMARGGVGRRGGIHIFLAHRADARRAAFDFGNQPKSSPAESFGKIAGGRGVGQTGANFSKGNGLLGGGDFHAHIGQNLVEDRFQGLG
jgi:hypothetical protein